MDNYTVLLLFSEVLYGKDTIQTEKNQGQSGSGEAIDSNYHGPGGLGCG